MKTLLDYQSKPVTLGLKQQFSTQQQHDLKRMPYSILQKRRRGAHFLLRYIAQ